VWLLGFFVFVVFVFFFFLFFLLPPLSSSRSFLFFFVCLPLPPSSSSSSPFFLFLFSSLLSVFFSPSLYYYVLRFPGYEGHAAKASHCHAFTAAANRVTTVLVGGWRNRACWWALVPETPHGRGRTTDLTSLSPPPRAE